MRLSLLKRKRLDDEANRENHPGREVPYPDRLASRHLPTFSSQPSALSQSLGPLA